MSRTYRSVLSHSFKVLFSINVGGEVLYHRDPPPPPFFPALHFNSLNLTSPILSPPYHLNTSPSWLRNSWILKTKPCVKHVSLCVEERRLGRFWEAELILGRKRDISWWTSVFIFQWIRGHCPKTSRHPGPLHYRMMDVNLVITDWFIIL